MFEQLLDFYTSVFTPYYLNKCGKDKPDWRNKIVLMQNYLTLFANRAEYKGLPDSFMGQMGKNRLWLSYLFFSPCIAWFKHEALGLICLPAMPSGKLSVSGLPSEWTAYSANGQTFKLNEKNSVLMFNDYSFSIPFIKLLYNTEFMLECDNTHRQNLLAQRQPLLMEIEEDEKRSANDFVSKLNSSVVVVRKRQKAGASKRAGEMPYDTKTFESGRKFEGSDLASDYRYFDNRNLSMLGYNNENLEKKERLLVDEVNSNNEVVDSYYTTAIDCQKEAFKAINEMFGYNIEVIPKRMISIKGEDKNVQSNSTLQQGQTPQKSDSGLEKEME